MQKGLLIVLLLILLAIPGCGDTPKDTNKELQRQVKELEQQIEIYQIEKDNYTQILNSSLNFIQAMHSKDIKALEDMLSEEYELIKQDNRLLVRKTDNFFEWQLYAPELLEYYHGLTLQNYIYNEVKDTFHIQIRLIYLDSDGNIQSPPTFLNLTYDRSGQVVELEFDV